MKPPSQVCKERRATKTNIDLGLALLSVLRIPGESLTLEDIAAWCGCSRERIRQIENTAFVKLRSRLSEEEFEAIGAHIFDERRPAFKT